MRRLYPLFVLLLFAMACNPPERKPEKEHKQTLKVDPFLGAHRGNVMPGASLPFGLVKVSPDVTQPQPTSGYTPYKPIVGFSHTHTSGTGGGPRYGNIMVVPQAGPVNLESMASVKKRNEYAAPGYYHVRLARKPGDVEAALTCTKHAAIHKYRFYTWGNEKTFPGNILIDVSHTNTRGGPKDSRCTGGAVQVNSDTQISGYGAYAGGWGEQNPYRIYFAAKFNTPFQSAGLWKGQEQLPDKKQLSIEPETAHTHRDFGAYAHYSLKQNQTIKVKVAISLISTKKARANLKEIPDWNFEHVRRRADSLWNDKLARIEVGGGTPEQEKIFYSALRNTMIMPTDITGENPDWQSKAPNFWDHYCIWDVYRSVMPLHTIIMPDHQRRVIKNLLDIYDHRGWLPDSWVAGDYADVQGGTNADVVIADAAVKGLGGFDLNKAYKAIKKNGEQISDNPHNYGRYLEDYLEYGYVTHHSTNGASSRTLEYAYNDYCIAQVAHKLGKEQDYNKYLKRSETCFKLFHDSAGMFWAKDTLGNWEPGFSPKPIADQPWNDPYFYEGGTQVYSMYVPHDMQGLIKHMGSTKAFEKHLDDLFENGNFDLGNEPLFLVPYLYNYIGKPAKTAERVRQILARQYMPASQGLPGQDDSGAMSSWYIFSALGFFPVAGQDLYLIGSPVFKEANIHLENGKIFRISAPEASAKNKYVQSASLNGKKLKRNWFRHSTIKNGGILKLEMGSEPSDWGRVVPPSLTNSEDAGPNGL